MAENDRNEITEEANKKKRNINTVYKSDSGIIITSETNIGRPYNGKIDKDEDEVFSINTPKGPSIYSSKDPLIMTEKIIKNKQTKKGFVDELHKVEKLVEELREEIKHRDEKKTWR